MNNIFAGLSLSFRPKPPQKPQNSEELPPPTEVPPQSELPPSSQSPTSDSDLPKGQIIKDTYAYAIAKMRELQPVLEAGKILTR